ncbi:uncharacterized protein LOC18029357 [Eutrema salsugineum]|uniref:uncharacterized protein LOC18029357 n=1 Tax=Eutrema salsugineum TaxID=72664 RepID=UPI000CED786F|nr:uncharacterized protein LOC18029357 [Eutrema salsugineum]
MTKLFETTHRKRDGSFVDARSEEIYNAAIQRIAEREIQATPDGTIQVPLTVAEQDQIFEEVAPKKKGRTLGMGSIRDCPAASASGFRTQEDPSHLRQELATANAEITTLRHEQVAQKQELTEIHDLFDIIAEAVPQLTTAIRARQQRARGVFEAGGTSGRPSDQQTQGQSSAPVVQTGNDGPAATGGQDGEPPRDVDLNFDDYEITL